MKRLVELISGHNNLSYSQFKVDQEINLIWRFCEEENETLHNFITSCPRLRQLRLDSKGLHSPIDWKLNNLIDFSLTPEINDYLERKDSLLYWNLQ